ncbi:threonine aldolase family protein [Oleiharenicola lentus]|uniref:threonine aldolase family protein n=1 Tax=Oleiharenicola lentus TaxID=2508720 RepID=UPI003F681F39
MPADAPHDFSFASDNTAGITPESLAAITAANASFVSSYGNDDLTTHAKQLIRDVFETDCDVFFVFNGTAANALALSAACRSYHGIFCHASAHVDNDECGAPEFFTGGAKVIPISHASGKLQPGELERAILKRPDVHYSKAGAVSLTQSTEWGNVYTPAEIRPVSDVAKKHGLFVQMDGARFANATAALASRGATPADFTWRAGVDVLSFGGTKNGMFATEAVVFFNKTLAQDFAYRVKQTAQLSSKMRFAAAQWIGALESGAWLRHAAHANAQAQRVATALRTFPQVKFITEPEVNGVFVEMPKAAAEALWARGWHFYRFIGDDGYRLMCSWATSPATVDRFIADARAVFSNSAK